MTAFPKLFHLLSINAHFFLTCVLSASVFLFSIPWEIFVDAQLIPKLWTSPFVACLVSFPYGKAYTIFNPQLFVFNQPVSFLASSWDIFPIRDIIFEDESFGYIQNFHLVSNWVDFSSE